MQKLYSKISKLTHVLSCRRVIYDTQEVIFNGSNTKLQAKAIVKWDVADSIKLTWTNKHGVIFKDTK